MTRARAPLSCLCLSIGLLIALSTLSFPVYAGSSDLTVDSIWLERASAPGVPVAGTDLSSNESFNIVASIKNLGQETANGYYLDVYYDSDYGRGGPDNIVAGEVQEWYVGPLTATAGTHTTQWVTDPDNQIAELDEQNNVREYVFTFGSGEPQTTTGSTATFTATVTQNATSYAYGTMTVTSYTSTETSTSTIPTTIVLVPLTMASTAQSTQYLTSILTTTVTSYTGTETSTSTIVVPTTVTLAPSVVTSTVQITQVVTSTRTTAITGYTTTTLTSYAGTERSTSTIVVPTTVTSGPSAATLTVQVKQAQTSTRTTTETKHTTMTTTVYTRTLTSTSTRVVYTTATRLGSVGLSSSLTCLGLLSLLALAIGRVSTDRSWRTPQVRPPVKGTSSKSQRPNY